MFFVFAAIKNRAQCRQCHVGGLFGSVRGFLIYNHYPAKVFMGITGAMALGGAVVLLAVVMRLQIFILLTGAIYVLEALSVVASNQLF